MAGISLLLPKEEMVKTAKHYVKKEGLNVKEIRHIVSENAISEARKDVAEGASVVIARGYQALVIKNYTNIPVIEITLTGQEIGMMVKKAKSMLGIPRSVIGLVGFQNMYSNVDYFDELFDVEMRQYLINFADDLPQTGERAVQDDLDILIGGDVAIMAAQRAGLPYFFVESTFDSIREAIKSAESAIYAAQVEQRYVAQIETFLDNSPDGFIRINTIGVVTNTNHIMQEILQSRESDILGKELAKLIPGIDKAEIENVLDGKSEMYSSFIRIKGNSVVIMLTAVKVGEMIDSAILSCHLVKKKEKIEAERIQEMYLNGYVAHVEFSSLDGRDKEMKECVEQAKIYSQSSNPILIVGETGSETTEFAEAVHNNSVRKSGPFVRVNCSSMNEEQQEEVFFGVKTENRKNVEKMGAVIKANHGTLLVEEIENLTMSLQRRLIDMIQNYSVEDCGTESLGVVDVRIIAVSGSNLYQKMLQGEFRQDLYYAISSLQLQIPPLRERPIELERYIMSLFKEKMTHYKRYHVLTPAAKELLMHYGWHGNKLQLSYFMDRMILSAKKRRIEADYVEKLLMELYPVVEKKDGQEYLIVYKDTKAEELMKVLKKYHGNRDMAAQELGISKTTLWRHMKKYGLDGYTN